MSASVRAAAPVLWRLALFTAAWIVMTGGMATAGPLGVAVILAATAVSLRLQPPGTWRWNAGGLVRFIPYFVRQSVSGGFDVAGRALLPRGPLAPDIVEYAMRLPEGPARRFFAGAIGLLPGTLTTEMRGARLIVHVLDRDLPVAAMLAELEARTAALFGVVLD